MIRSAILALIVAGSAMAADLTLATAGKTLAKAPLPEGWSVAASGETLTIIPAQKRPHIQVWAVAASTVAEAEPRLAALIESQVKGFTAEKTVELTVAGAKARQFIGTGVEADDGDPSNAEVTLFTVGGKVFVLVSHGEGNGTAERHADLAALLAAIDPARR